MHTKHLQVCKCFLHLCKYPIYDYIYAISTAVSDHIEERVKGTSFDHGTHAHGRRVWVTRRHNKSFAHTYRRTHAHFNPFMCS